MSGVTASDVQGTPPTITIDTRFGAGFASYAIIDPTLTGSVDMADAGRAVTVSNGATVLGTTIAAADGTWSDRVTLPSAGSYSLTASVINVAGKIASATATFNIDLTGNIGLFGTVTRYAADVTSVAGDIYALYQTILGRAPDPYGFESWVAVERSGTSIASIVQSFLSSPEYVGGYGATAQSDQAFVSQLYLNGLHRQAEPYGSDVWTAALANGTSRTQVALGVALSSEGRGNLTTIFEAGVFVPNAADTSVTRLYYGLLDRAPDGFGLQTWAAAVNRGETIVQVAQGFLDSPEYAAGHAGLSNADFVNALYQGALGHTAAGDANAQSWVSMLDSGASRASVGVGISESPDAVVHLLPAIESGLIV